MWIVSLVLALALAAVAWLLLTSRRSIGHATEQLAQRSAKLDRSSAELREANDRARLAEEQRDDAAEHVRALQIDLETVTVNLDRSRVDVEDLNHEIDEADRLAEHQSAELASMAIETEELSGQLADALRLVETHRRSAAVTAAATAAATGVDPATLWELELARSERTWRYSVAIHPDDPNPFADCDDPLKLAVETEASALRDEVGAFLSVEWKTEPVDDPARAHLILRVAQELLAMAARVDAPTVLRAEQASEGVVLTVVPVDDGDQVDLDLRQFGEERFGATGWLARGVEGVSSVTVLAVG